MQQLEDQDFITVVGVEEPQQGTTDKHVAGIAQREDPDPWRMKIILTLGKTPNTAVPDIDIP